MADGQPKTFGDRYATVIFGVFCTLGSMVYIKQLPWQYPFAHASEVAAVKTEVAAVKTQIQENSAEAAVVAEQADTATERATNATNTATKAVTVAKTVKIEAKKIKNEDLVGQTEIDRRIQQLRRDINQNQMDIAKIKKRLGIM